MTSPQPPHEPGLDRDDDDRPGVRRVHEFRNRTYIVADVEPLDVTGVRTVGVGGLMFFIVALALTPFYSLLADNDRTWWLWTCYFGAGLGLYGWTYCRRRAHEGTTPRDTAE